MSTALGSPSRAAGAVEAAGEAGALACARQHERAGPVPPRGEPFRLKAAEVMPLSVRSDAPAAWRAAGHFATIGVVGTALWFARGSWWAIALTVLLGYVLAFLFTLEHETAHQTAFRTRAWNYVLGHVAGVAILLPYEYYRAFHWEHHRHTQDPERDPELAVPLPATPAGLLWTWSGAPILIGRLRLLFAHGVRGKVTVPWVPPDKRRLIVREARAYLAGYLLLIGAAVATGSGAIVWLWLLPLLVGQLFLRPYLLAEHTGCGHSNDMLENTRTTYTNGIVRFFAWNMPFHAEHHAYPAVPFHALPSLNRLLARHIVHTEPGYRAATGTVIRHLLSEQAAAPAPPPTDR